MQAELLKRKAQLNKGFGAALSSAAATSSQSKDASTGSNATGAAKPSTVADEAEVARVLNAPSDYECLKVSSVQSAAACPVLWLLTYVHPLTCVMMNMSIVYSLYLVYID